ncbi:MAG: porin [Acetobacteraceae bacterium]|nr:porin [Acetobacteraceae bacterium]
MRKLLLGTTAAVGVALIGATGASAQEAPTVRIGGYFDFSANYIRDTADRGTLAVPNARQWDFRADTEIHVFVTGKAANGLTYGAVIEFEMDAVGAGAAGTTFSTDEMWGFVSSPTLGTLRFGDEDSAANLMQVRPPLATGFIRSRVDLVRQGGTRYMFSSLNDGNDATKIIYLSPQFFGFDFGLSFALNGGEGEREVLGATIPAGGGFSGGVTLQRARTTRENEFTGAVRYRGTFGAVGVAAGFGFTTATAARNSANDTLLPALRGQNPNAYSVGATVTFAGFTFGGEYTWGRWSGVSPGIGSTPPGLGDSRHFLLGASYAIPSAGITLTANYGRGSQPLGAIVGGTFVPLNISHTARVFTVGATYTIAPGWTAYVTYENYRDTNYSTGVAANNFGGGTLGSIGGVPAAVGSRRTSDALMIGTTLAF